MTGTEFLKLPALCLALALGVGCGGSGQSNDSDAKQGKSGSGAKGKSKKKSGKGAPKGEGKDSTDPGEDSSQPGQPKFDMSIPEPNGNGEDPVCDIDFLFVVDNSRSMVDNQKSLANSVPDFIKTIEKDITNLRTYHIGVISTDESKYNEMGDVKHCARLGGLIVRTADYTPGAGTDFDRRCLPYASKKHFMTREDDLNEKFTCAAKLGPMGNGNERPMDALEAAISDDLTKKGSCNEDFFRENAILVVVIVSDEEDDVEVEDGSTNGSKGDPKLWHDRLVKFKGGNEELVVVLSLIGNPKPNQCDWTYEPGGEPKDGKGIKSAEVSKRLIDFTKRFGKRGSIGDICADSYKDFFTKAVETLTEACTEIPG